jgi:MFS family permease
LAADRFGAKRLFLGSVQAFALGSLLCAMAPNITLLIAFRAIQGFAAGIFMPLNYTILTPAAGPKRVGRLLALMNVPTLLAPICGPILGGWLIDFFGWQWIFLINIPLGVTTVVLAGIVFPKIIRAPHKPSTSLACCCCHPAWRYSSWECRPSRGAAR